MMLACPCGATHETLVNDQLDGPLIFCVLVKPGRLVRVDTRYLCDENGRIYREYDGPLWIAYPDTWAEKTLECMWDAS